MSTFNCRNCCFWKADPVLGPSSERQPTDSECRRHAPRLKFDRFDSDMTSSTWPPTSAGDWCGEHRPTSLPLPFATTEGVSA